MVLDYGGFVRSMALMRIRLSNILSISLVFTCTWVWGRDASALKIWKSKTTVVAAPATEAARATQARNDQSDAAGAQIGMKVPQAPENARALTKHSKLGDSYFERKDYTNALIECQAVLKEDPDNYKAHYMLSKILIALNDFDEA